MAKPFKETAKRRGRPSTGGRGEGILVPLQPEKLKAVDAWIAKHDPSLTRPEGIRAMIDAAVLWIKELARPRDAKTAIARPS